jgi:hypothetical protein
MFGFIKDILDIRRWKKVIESRLDVFAGPDRTKPTTLAVRVWWWRMKH